MKSEKITVQGKQFFVDSISMEDPNVVKLFLYEDSNLQKPAKTITGHTRMVRKEDIEEMLKVNEGGAGGAGYAVYGGGGGFGNPSLGGRFYGRGFGFGNRGSSTGPNLMYTYSIKPLDPILQQPATPQGDGRYIHVGNHVTGKELNGEKEVDGKIITIKEDGEGNILYYLVQDFDTAVKFKVDPTSATLISQEDRPHSIADFMGEEEYYPRLGNFVNEGWTDPLSQYIREYLQNKKEA